MDTFRGTSAMEYYDGEEDFDCHNGLARIDAHKGDVTFVARAHRRCNSPEPALGHSLLPPGCALGFPIAEGTEAVLLPQGKELFQVVMSFVEQDDYYAIIEFVRRSGRDVDIKRKCGFSVALTPEDGRGNNVPRQLTVRGASLLSYAICIGSFRAATALLVACPSFLSLTCTVFTGMEDGEPTDEQTWTSSDLVRIFCMLYSEEESCDEEVLATAALYNLARPVIDVGEEDITKLPFLGLRTAAQRIAAAGNDSEIVIQELSLAAARHLNNAE